MTAAPSELEIQLLHLAQREISPSQLANSFDAIANLLLNDTQLVIGTESFRICEMEFYFSSEYYGHVDPYSHYNQFRTCTRPGEFGEWYFHRLKSVETYSRQRFRGLDLTFGMSNYETYGGILIRKIQNGQKAISGIGRIVSYIEMSLGISEIMSLGTKSGKLAFQNDSPLHLKSDRLKELTVHKTRRVLPLPKSPEKTLYFDREYRYFIDSEE